MSTRVLLKTFSRTWMWVTLVCLAGVAISAELSLPTVEELQPSNEQLNIDVHKSQLVRLGVPAERVSVVSPDIADVQIIEPRQILVTALSVGETSMIIWTEDGQTRVIDVRVNWNTRLIEESIRQALPNDAVRVVSMQDGVALQGSTHSPLGVDTAMEIARAYSPHVVNLMDTPGVQQVMLKVRVAEVVRSFNDERGVNFRFVDRSFVGSNLIGNLFEGDLTGGFADVSEAVTLFFGFPKSNVDVFVRALQESGVLQVLAEPNLIARSGETASFLAGGEFPIPVIQSGVSGSITIDYKEFGVRIEFTPTVLEERQIHLQVSAEVSDLDFSRGVQLGGFVIPTVTTRRANTVVRLQDEQTFAIAGLISKQQHKTRQKIPGLGDIPLLGGLFKASQFEDVETEVLIIVTPILVSPLEAGETPPLPTDLFKDAEGRWRDEVQYGPRQRERIYGIPLDKIQSEEEIVDEYTSTIQYVPVEVEESIAHANVPQSAALPGEVQGELHAIPVEVTELSIHPRISQPSIYTGDAKSDLLAVPVDVYDIQGSPSDPESNSLHIEEELDPLPWTPLRPMRRLGGIQRR